MACRNLAVAPSRTSELIYGKELQPVITTGTEVMEQIFR